MESTLQRRNCILEKQAVGRKLRRMALEVAEQNADVEELLIAGIEGNGVVVARNLIRELTQIRPFRITYVTIRLNKKEPGEISIDGRLEARGKVVILVDDVANSGRTLFYALKPFLDQHPAKVQTLVLVERSHKLFPIQTDYFGLSVSTTLQEHIMVETEEDEISGAWLY